MSAGRWIPRPGTLIAILALTVAMGGAAYAASKIGPKQIKPEAVRTGKIADSAVTGEKIADGAVTAADLEASQRSEAFVTSNPNPLEIRPDDAEFTDADRVAVLQLPPGAYVVNASIAVAGTAAAGDNFLGCNLRDDGATLSGGGARRNGGPGIAGARLQGTIAMTGVSDGGAVDVVCQTAVQAIARFRTITAIRVGGVQVQP